jgi:cytochrome P450
MRPSAIARPPRPPGPKLSPVGVVRLFASGSGRVLDLLTGIADGYPRVACIRVFGETAYLVSDPDLVREVLVIQGRSLKKGRGLEQASRLLGNGLLTSEGDEHREQRKLIQPAFHGERVRTYAEQMAAAAERVEWADGEVVDLAAEMARLTLDVVGRTLFGVDLTGSAADVRTALTDFLEAFGQVAGPGGNLVLRVRPGLRAKLDAAQAKLDRVVYELIASRRESYARGISGDDLVSLLLPTGMSDTELRDQALTFVLAGHETTANLLTWACWLLDPATGDALAAEANAARGAASYDDRPFARAVVAEAMRLYPPAYAIGRRAVADFELDSWLVPAGSLVITSQWVTSRDQRWWGRDAQQFRPTRWLDADGRFDPAAPGHPRMAYHPFGAGSRICIGEDFAWLEATLLLSSLARRYRITADPAFPGVSPAITLRPGGPVPAQISRRAHAPYE